VLWTLENGLYYLVIQFFLWDIFSYNFLENYVHSFFNPFLCYADFSFFHGYISGAIPVNWTIALFWSEIYFAISVYRYCYDETALYWVLEVTVYAIGVTKIYIGTTTTEKVICSSS
jgi:hypothetical protein